MQFFIFFALPQEYQVPLLSGAAFVWTAAISFLGSSKAAAEAEEVMSSTPAEWLGPTSRDELSVTVDELTDSVTLEDVADAVGSSEGAQAALLVAGIAVATSAGPGEAGGAIASAATGALEEGGANSFLEAQVIQDVLEAQAIPIALVLGSAGQAVTNTAEEALEEASTSGAEEEHDEEDDNSVKSKSEERTLR